MYIIGDLHSNIDELNNLLSLLKLKKGDLLIFLGDYIDKNIYTKEILKMLMFLKKRYRCVFIKGDHEFVWGRYLLHNELFRREFLLNYGGIESLRQFTENSEELIRNDKINEIKKYLSTYLELVKEMRDYYLVDNYLALHAGLLKEQFSQKQLIFKEINYFIRPDKMIFDKLYLNKYIIVAGHTNIEDAPVIKEGYLNIDLGAGYQKYLGAFDVKNNKVIRSDKKIFKLN